MINIVALLSALAVMLPLLYEVNIVLFVADFLVFIIIGFFWFFYD